MYRGACFSDIEPAAVVVTFPCNGNQSGQGWEANVPAEGGDTPIHSLFWTWYCSIASTILDVVKEYHPSLVY